MSLLSTDALPTDPIDAIRQITASELEIDRLRCELVKQARESGRSWEQIASALGTSRQAAWEYYTSRFRREFDKIAETENTLSENEATDLAVEESSAVRRRRLSSRLKP
ncbi:MAG: hypothetical protein F2894_05995 [Actinobacteria bacterium]|uniref:Unannotated protein n=1 Tax=freshwater metagenome TaxID=449393 RepID=A0A6J7QNG0_9ZZZZ|nr:hypothetical protein [Actinomycetota bacterium]MSZ29926.1 hypothetical protein [Actinomycetota bacterium]